MVSFILILIVFSGNLEKHVTCSYCSFTFLRRSISKTGLLKLDGLPFIDPVSMMPLRRSVLFLRYSHYYDTPPQLHDSMFEYLYSESARNVP